MARKPKWGNWSCSKTTDRASFQRPRPLNQTTGHDFSPGSQGTPHKTTGVAGTSGIPGISKTARNPRALGIPQNPQNPRNPRNPRDPWNSENLDSAHQYFIRGGSDVSGNAETEKSERLATTSEQPALGANRLNSGPILATSGQGRPQF